jgi:hypothetical protein
MSRTSSAIALPLLLAVLSIAPAEAEQQIKVDVTDLDERDEETREETLAEIDRQLNNPLTTIWSLTFENNLVVKEGDAIRGTTLANTLFFQPGLPVPVGANKETVLIARPVFPLVTNPVLDPDSSDGVGDHDTGLGDIQLLSLLGPNRKDGVVWGLGGTGGHTPATTTARTQGRPISSTS